MGVIFISPGLYALPAGPARCGKCSLVGDDSLGRRVIPALPGAWGNRTEQEIANCLLHTLWPRFDIFHAVVDERPLGRLTFLSTKDPQWNSSTRNSSEQALSYYSQA